MVRIPFMDIYKKVGLYTLTFYPSIPIQLPKGRISTATFFYLVRFLSLPLFSPSSFNSLLSFHLLSVTNLLSPSPLFNLSFPFPSPLHPFLLFLKGIPIFPSFSSVLFPLSHHSSIGFISFFPLPLCYVPSPLSSLSFFSCLPAPISPAPPCTHLYALKSLPSPHLIGSLARTPLEATENF